MSGLVEFYRGQGSDSEGRTLAEIWAWRDDDLEAVHNFIQWLFPLPEPSRFNPDAPLLTTEDVAAFHADPFLRAQLHRSFERILSFCGLALAEGSEVVEGPNFAARVPDVWAYANHNWLRITRILKCLRLLGLEADAQAFYARLRALYSSRRYPIGGDTFRYWTDAVSGPPPRV
jgi:hypothetical protein